MPQIPSLFGLSQDDANLAIQNRDEQHALDVAHLNRGQLMNYNGAHVGDMLGQGILSAFGAQDPIAAKSQKLQQVQQLTEQQAPWETDPEAHMKLAVSNLMKAGMQTEAGNAYQSLLAWKKNATESMNAQSIAGELDIKKKDRTAQDKADADFSTYLQNLQNPQAPQNQQPQPAQPDQPTSTLDISTPENIKALRDSIETIRKTKPDEAAQVEAALDRQIQQSQTFKPPTDPNIITRAMMSGSPKAVAWAKLMKEENDKAQALWTTQNVVSANTKAMIGAKPTTLVLTTGEDGQPVYTKQADAVGKVAAPKPSASAGSDLTPDAIELAATRYRIDGTMPALGMGSAGTRSKILNKAAELAAAEGQTKESAALRQVANKANAAGLAQLTKQQTMVGAFEKTANQNADLALSLSEKVNRAGSPVLDRWIQAGRKSVSGDADVAKFHAATQTFVNEYAKIMSGSMGNTAVSDSARNEANSILSTALTKQQYRDVIATLKTEMQNRIQGFADQKQELMASMGNTPPTAPQAPAPKTVHWDDLK